MSLGSSGRGRRNGGGQAVSATQGRPYLRRRWRTARQRLLHSARSVSGDQSIAGMRLAGDILPEIESGQRDGALRTPVHHLLVTLGAAGGLNAGSQQSTARGLANFQVEF